MKNTLLILYGPSGSGKTSATRLLAAKYGIPEIISITSRPQRKGEVNGKDYFFVSYDRAAEMLGTGELIEHTIYDGHIYGIWKKELDNKVLNNKVSCVVTDLTGARQLMELYPDNTKLIHLGAKIDILYNRILERKQSLESVENRMKTVEKELSQWVYADLVVNTGSMPVEKVADTIYEFATKEPLVPDIVA